MLHSDSKDFQDFAKAYEKAGQKIEEVLIKTRANSVNEYQIKVQKALDGISISLNQANKKWAEKDIKSGYNKGSDLVDKETNHKHTAPDYSKINDRPLNSYIQLSSSVSIATENAKRFVNQKIAELESSGEITISKVKQELYNSMRKEQNGLLSVRYRDGKQFRLDKYAEMTARTTRIETANKGVFDRCEDLGIDLVRCTTVPNCCPYCKKYEGKVYSISGKDSRYPALYKTALQSGYDIMHPNCRHEFLPFQEKLYTKQELSSIQKESNHFTNPDKNDKIFTTYNSQQAFLQKRNRDFLEYGELKRLFGADMPYKSFAGYRSSRRAKSSNFSKIRTETLDLKKQEYIKSDRCNKKVNASQNKHFIDNKQYMGDSYIVATMEEIQTIVDNFAGTGKILRTKNGRFNNKELIITNSKVGHVKSKEGNWVETNRFIIHYSNKGVHIVPTLREMGLDETKGK